MGTPSARSWTALAGALLLSGSVLAGGGEPLLPQPRVNAPSLFPESYAFADVDGDGRADVVHGFISNVHVTPAGPQASYAGGADVQAGAPANFSNVLAGDVTGDLWPDIVGMEFMRVSVLPGVGGGAFGAAVVSELPPQLELGEGVLADFDLDGNLDLACPDDESPQADVLRGLGDGNFELLTTIAAGGGVGGMATADVNADGHADLAFGSGSNIALSYGLPGGGFTPVTLYAGASSPTGVVFADLDGDAWPDLASTSSDPTKAVVRLLNQGDGTFGPGAATAMDVAARELAALDLDGDADVDLAVGRNSQGPLRFARNDGAGTLAWQAAEDLWLADRATRPRAADADGDGRPDLAAWDGRNVSIVRSTAAGLDLPLESPLPEQTWPPLLAAVDGDARADLVVPNGARVDVLLAQPDGGFAAPVSTVVGSFPSVFIGPAAGDMDGDDVLDLVGVYVQEALVLPSAVRVLRGTGAGTFHVGPIKATADSPDSTARVVLADLDLDGDLDASVSGPDALNLFEGTGTGGLYNAVTVPFAGEHAWGDVDADGLPDLVRHADGQAIEVDFALGGLSYARGPSVAQSSVSALVLRDLDGDDRDEIVAGISNGPLARVLEVDGSGQLVDQVILAAPAAVGTLGVALMDVSGDGHVDLLGGSFDGFYIARGDGAGGVAPPEWHRARGTEALAGDTDGDGIADVVAVDRNSQSVGPAAAQTFRARPAGPWIYHEVGVAGLAGTPRLSGMGTLQAGTPVALRLREAAPSATSFLVLGFAELYAALKGATLYPSPVLLVGPLATDTDGAWLLPGTWPAGLPPRTSVAFQAWVQDAAGPQGYAATNGLQALTP